MKRIVLWLASTVTIVVLLFGYHTSTNKISSAAAPDSTSSPTSTTSSQPTASPSTKITAYQGSVAQTRWGPVQVQITVQGGKIIKVSVLQQPNGNHRDAEINDQALPVLINETMSAQSAQIDMISGATVTSEGYVQSLQAALDEARR
ncbi:MAG TPA: FMN-binding protein [Propionibacteriaceae bacterium]